MTVTEPRASVGTPVARIDGEAKVLGLAKYAYEQVVDNPAFLHPVQATVARGRVTGFDSSAAEALEGVLLVLSHLNAPALADTSDQEYAVLQSPGVAFRGQIIGAVVAESPETARHAAELVRVTYDQHPHDTELREDHPDLYEPGQVNPSYPADTDDGGVDQALAAAEFVVDHRYTTPMEHNNPMEPHACTALWQDGPRLTLHDSTQSVHGVRTRLSGILGLDPEAIRVVSPYVGGGFGSKGMPHAHNVLVVLAAQLLPGRPVKLVLTRQQMFTLVGYRTPTLQRVRLGADAQGRITAVSHEAVEQTSRIKEFAEQTTVGTRSMYAGDARRTTHRLVALDVAVPSWMRAPGEAPGMFGLESAMDELAETVGLDPVELRVRNDPATDPETGLPWSSRHLVECLHEGAARFGWDLRRAPGSRREGDWLVGLGMASSTYPAYLMPGNTASVSYGGHGHYSVRIGAADIGTGSWTALTQIAADALGMPFDHVHLEIGDTQLPRATVEGGSAGLASHGSAILLAGQRFRVEHGDAPEAGATTEATTEPPGEPAYATHSYGAQFVEARVNVDTGEVRVPRMVGVFSCGRIVNPRTARSQLIGGMVWGLSMALHEKSVVDHALGHVVTHDLADYHVLSHADIGDIDVTWLDEEDPHANPLGAKGIGEIGITGTAAAVASAVHNATGRRIRDLPITPDKLLLP
ncbi:xanthine dehydrogenase family protein molybdopterin-binding subunit [Nocardioides panacis]|uniref:Xanthine dehydrogenase family protein molybdopterin-binding subunit n=1 Tax=Nocardioides panacis TaxID=2849501 RepID=A0A975T071_9ACTN|nr:xanthine dehydrogenase family protein molybdopterin-binding subunit [Nocardioides panacis]QWZ09208.1 xanthine dehydrogenase family protein molybdopterin-binding subunit [Nocardioides panacis]